MPARSSTLDTDGSSPVSDVPVGHRRNGHERRNRTGVAVVGLGGAVATTAVAGIELLRNGRIDTAGLPLADLPHSRKQVLPEYQDLVFGGWDLCPDDLATAAKNHNVLTESQLELARRDLSRIKPWPAVGNQQFCRNIECAHVAHTTSHLQTVDFIRRDLRAFREQQRLDSVVMVNLASTERQVDATDPQFRSLKAFESALEQNHPQISPALLYAYSAISERVPYINFTPSTAVDIPALIEFADRTQTPVCGKDGKTGQTMMKTAIAPALRTRALHVDGWYSANILGNRDGQALNDKDSLASKLATKGSVLDQILGYHVEDHLVDIRYYRPRGDNKESWDNIDVTGFLGQQMQIKVNFLCRDSVLAAPLVIELVRLMDCALRSGCGGVQEQFGLFFKSPMIADGSKGAEHALHVQESRLMEWLSSVPVQQEATVF